MTCDQGPCVVKEYVLDVPPAPEGGGVPPKTAAVVAVKLSPELPVGTSVDLTAATAEDAIVEKFERDFQKAIEVQCKPGCKCIKNTSAKVEEGSYDVPISTTYSDTNGRIYRAEGTVRIKTKDTPGKCFVDPAVPLPLRTPDVPEYPTSLGVSTGRFWLLMIPGVAQLVIAMVLHAWLSTSESITLIITAAISFVYALHIYKSIELRARSIMENWANPG